MESCNVAVLGAGPYGLAAAAHLRAAGVETRVFGRAMAFWEAMPAGMLLRSAWEASHIDSPGGALSLDAFESARGAAVDRPVPLADFVAYGRWFGRRAAPDLDPRTVERVERGGRGFRLRLEDGEMLRARRVVVAAGIAPFAWRPAALAGLPAEAASHASEHRDFGGFAGRRVLVVGGGQSALESAALLREGGAEVRVAVRGPRVHWLRGDRVRRVLGPLAYTREDVGPPGINRVVSAPRFWRALPRGLRERIAARAIRGAAAAWLRARIDGIPIDTGVQVLWASPSPGGVRVGMDDGTVRAVDHVLAATGYRVDVARYPFLAPELVAAMRIADGYPEVGRGFESLLAGLHFLGAPAARSWGPTMRFVSGTRYAARRLAAHVAGAAVARAEEELEMPPLAVPKPVMAGAFAEPAGD